MLKWNQAGLKWNAAGLKWNATGRRPIMAKVKLSLKDLSDSELLELSRAHIAAMAGNANFTTPTPSAASFLTTTDAFEAKMTAKDTAVAAAKEAVLERDDARAAQEDVLRQRGAYVDTTSAGDAIKIASSGFATKAPATPSGLPGQPQSVAASTGDLEHTIELAWDRMRNVNSYVIQKCPDPENPANYVLAGISTKSSATIAGLTPGTKYWFRVAAVGAAGQGPWSDPAAKMAE